MAVQRDFDDDGGSAAGAAAGLVAVVDGGQRHGEGAADRAQRRLEVAFAEAAGFPPEVFSTAVINSLTNLETGGLGYEESVDLLEAAGKLASAVEALKVRAVARVAEAAVERVGGENLNPSGPAVERSADGVAVSEVAAV